MKTVYCPRCDRPYTSLTRVLAMMKMEKHLRKAHPDFIEMYDLEK